MDKLAIKNPESVADHTYSMAIIGMILSDSQKYDTQKILKMIFLHDLAESITGDFTPEAKIKRRKSNFGEIKPWKISCNTSTRKFTKTIS